MERAKTDKMVQLALTVNVKWGGYDPEAAREATMTVALLDIRRSSTAEEMKRGGGAAAGYLAGR